MLKFNFLKKHRKQWWKEAVFYQIYPRSFYDSDGDGNGDLRGIISKLDYLRDLGIGAVWLSPVYASPMADNGYDVSDYCAINPMFGTMDDFNELAEGLHRRGLKLMMDLVVNHTSVDHPWFRESRSSRDNPKRDWYIWRDGRDGREPNNWACHFMTSAWEWDEATGQYYLHMFSKEQPDLNWANPEVKKEMFAMMRFWLERGTDAFRMDMGNYLIKPDGLPDAPRRPGDSRPFVHGEGLYANQPGMLELIAEMRREVLDPYGAALFGELYFLSPETALAYAGYKQRRFDLLYQYEVVAARGDWRKAKESVRIWHETFMNKGWNTITFSNHDSPRPVSVFGDDRSNRTESAKCLATFLLTAPGTPFFLQGEEIGMTNVRFPDLSCYSDIEMKEKYRERMQQGEDPEAVFEDLSRWSRDNARTPMQWDGGRNAGFSPAEPWLTTNPNYREVNAAAALKDENSILHYYRALIGFRKKYKALVYGDYIPLVPDDWETYAYRRALGKSVFLVVINTSPRRWRMKRPDGLAPENEPLMANYPERSDSAIELDLRPWEARVYKL